MLGRTTYLAGSIVVLVQVVSINCAPAATSICSKAEECYVNGSTSKVCKRSEKKCNRCLSEMEGDSLWTTFGLNTEYACYAFIDASECPDGTTKCSAQLETSENSKPDETLENTNLDETSSRESATETPEEDSSQLASLFNSGRKTNTSSSSRDPDKSIPSSVSTLKEKATNISSVDDTSSSDSTSTPLKSIKAVSKGTDNEEVLESSASDSTSDPELDLATSDNADVDDNSAKNTHTESHGVKDSMLNQNNGPTDTPTIPQIPEAVANPTPVERRSSNTSSGNDTAGSNQLSLILGVVCAATVLVAVAGFVAWKKKANDDDSDDDDSAFSPAKPAVNPRMAAPPSASSATTAYTANSAYTSQPKNDAHSYRNDAHTIGNEAHSYGSQYSNPYNERGGYASKNPGDSSTHYAVPPSYGSPGSIDYDENDIRRTDSILGGTGVMLSTKTGGAAFAFCDEPSPSYSVASNDVWGNEKRKTRPRRSSSSASVEF